MDNIDEVITDLLNDPAGLAMMEAGMRDHVEKWTQR